MGGGSSKKQTVGYRYFLGMHMVLCYGPVQSLNKIFIGKRLAWSGNITSSTTTSINKPNLFGGEKKEGGVLGRVDVCMGESTQQRNSYLMNRLGPDIPAYRGVLGLVFREGSSRTYSSSGSGGYIAAMSPYPKAWAVEVTDIPGGNLSPTTQNINNGSANGAHIVYEALTDPDWGLGLGTGDLDIPAFESVAQQLYDEGFGLSLGFSAQTTMDEFIGDILTLINGVLYTDRVTGKFVLSLVRGGYDASTLPVFDETNIASMEFFERPSFAEMVNEIVIKFRPRGAFKDTAITVQDLASIQAQGGIVSQTKNFSGVDSYDIASRIGIRELRQSSSPLARVSFVANRSAWDVNPGDIVKLSWDAYGIEQLVVRITNMNYGTLTDGLVLIEGVEDIFGLPQSSYYTPTSTGWADTVGEPMPVEQSYLIEVPYYVVGTTLTLADFNTVTDDNAFAYAVAVKPDQPTFGFQLISRLAPAQSNYDNSEEYAGQFAPTARLAQDLDPIQETGISITDFSGAWGEIVIGGYAIIGNEYVRVDDVDMDNMIIRIGRGVFDTYPLSHSLNDRIYFADSNVGIIDELFTTGSQIRAKALTQTSLGILDITAADEMSLNTVGRFGKPYLPAGIQIAGEYAPELVNSNDILITWEHQDRTQQLAGIEDWYSVSLGSPEAGVTYELVVTNADTNALIQTQSGLTGTQYLLSLNYSYGTSFNMKIQMYSVRDSTYTSYQTYTAVFPFEVIDQRITQVGDIRITEDGSRRVAEEP